MIELEVEVRGPFANQPLLVRLGSIVAFVGFVIFGSFIPVSLAVAVICGVGAPAANRVSDAGPLAIVLGMALVGAWTSDRFLWWLTGGQWSLRLRSVFTLVAVAVSAALSFLAVALNVWPNTFLGAFATVLIMLLLSWLLIAMGQAASTLSSSAKAEPPRQGPT